MGSILGHGDGPSKDPQGEVDVVDARMLLIETSGRSGHVALASGAALVGVRRLDEARRHARDLAPAVAELLAEHGWRPADVAAVVVSRGPGSYTGLRVGIMSATTFAYATGCVLLAVDTFAALALQAGTAGRRVEVVSDAQQGKLYVQPFAHEGETVRPLADLVIRPAAEWRASVPSGALMTGPGLHGLTDLPSGLEVAPADAWEPHPVSLLRLALPRLLLGERDDLWSVEPLYLRLSSAEERWRARGT